MGGCSQGRGVDPPGLEGFPDVVVADGDAALIDLAVGVGESVVGGAKGVGEADFPIGDSGLAAILDTVGVEVVILGEVEAAGCLADIEGDRAFRFPHFPDFDGIVLNANLVPAEEGIERGSPTVGPYDRTDLRPGCGMVHVAALVPRCLRIGSPADEVMVYAVNQIAVGVQQHLDVVVRVALELDFPVEGLDARTVVENAIRRHGGTVHADPDGHCLRRIEHYGCRQHHSDPIAIRCLPLHDGLPIFDFLIHGRFPSRIRRTSACQ